MLQASRPVPVDELAAVIEATELRCVRIPDRHAAVRGVVLHAADDPVPPVDLLVLCTSPSTGVPPCAAVVIRQSSLAMEKPVIPPGTAVFAAPDDLRWSDIYDRVRWAVGESFGHLAERDVFHLADALALALGGAVSIEDARRHVVAFSTVPGQQIDDVRRKGILDRRVPEHVEREEWYARLRRSDTVVEYPAGPESTARMAIAVHIGNEPMGSIWVVGGRDVLSADADQILLRSVDTIAACLAHEDHFAARGREYRRDALLELFGHGARYANGPGPAFLIGVKRRSGEQDAELLDERLADVLSLHAHRLRGIGLAGVVDDRIYAVVPAVDREHLYARLTPTVARVEPEAVLVAVSRTFTSWSALPAARGEVDLAIRVHADGPCKPGVEIVYVDDEYECLTLAEIADAVGGLKMLRSGVVPVMDRYDSAHGTDYLATLRAWLETGGDVNTASARLFVHPNTFRYRMNRMRTLFDLGLERADQRLLLHLQVRIRDFPEVDRRVDAEHDGPPLARGDAAGSVE